MSTLNVDTLQDKAGAFEHARLVQVVNTTTGTMATGTTVMVSDDTTPQNDEGIELMTLAITPTHASNKLLIEVVIASIDSGANNYMFTALFQDSTSNALASTSTFMAADGGHDISFSHYMTTGTTSSTTFKVRAGGNNAATTTFNGRTAGAKMNGTFASSITISEIRV